MKRHFPPAGFGFFVTLLPADKILYEAATKAAEDDCGLDHSNASYLKFLQEFFLKHRAKSNQ